MANKHGDWIWYELMTGDPAASAAFYGAVQDWTFPPAKSEPDDYLEIQAGDEFVGGLLRLTPEMTAGGAHPAWIGYIAVDDVDASVASIEAAGGKTCMPARDMEGVGRFAMVSDCCGAPFYVMTPTSQPGGGESTAFSPTLPDRCSWNELMAGDATNAIAFYTGRFGWTLPDAMDMGPMGQYQFVAQGGMTIGAIMQKPAQVPVAGWNHYFRVASIAAAQAQVAAQGGRVINGPMQVPGDDWIVQGVDPQGAAFCLVGGK